MTEELCPENPTFLGKACEESILKIVFFSPSCQVYLGRLISLSAAQEETRESGLLHLPTTSTHRGFEQDTFFNTDIRGNPHKNRDWGEKPG